MLRSYFKIAIRNIFKNRTYSFINIAGLGLGLATGFIMLLWVNNEYSMNRYHKHSDRIYQVNAKFKSGNGETQVWETTPAPIALFARQNISDIEQIARLRSPFGLKQAVKIDNKIFIEDKIGYTENELFKIFDFPVIAGNPKEPFAKGLSVVLPESTAKKYFGEDDPVGKVLSFRDTTVVVSAVIKDFPANSSLQYSLLVSLDMAKLKFRGNGNWKTIDQDWGNYDYSTYCLLKKGGNIQNASTAMLAELKKANPQAAGDMLDFPFRPLKDVYLYKADGTKGRLIMVEIFFLVAIFVLLIASINYINLVTARSTQRIKEIGIRKIIGAAKRQLCRQFFIETGVLLALATVTAFLLMNLLMPVYQQVSGNTTAYDFANWQLWKVLGAIVAVVWLLTGLYPALLLSSFRPIESLKGKIFLSSTGFIRKSLVVLQFVVSITLVLGTVFIHRQLSYIQNKDLNINTSNVIVFPTWKMKGKGNDFKNEIQRLSYVQDITVADMSLFDGANSSGGLDWEGKATNENITAVHMDVDKNFMQFFHTDLKEGTDFGTISPGSPNFILNETAVRKMALQKPIGETIRFRGDTGIIIGVVKDFHFESLQKEIRPTVIKYNAEAPEFVYARVEQRKAQQLINFTEKFWKQIEPALPLEYAFLDDELARQYDKETRASHLFDAFAVITMFISCLGLFGLATYSAERRVKEIGIRKVLGAGTTRLASLLSREFIILVVIAIVIAIPIVWIGMTRLLNYFAYRISLQWWVFLATSVVAVSIAVITVSFQTIRAAVANPVKSLRTE
jgi:putative ABC transport system permease protein